MRPDEIQKEIICYLPDKDEPIIVPAGLEDAIRAKYMGHPEELKVKIEPWIADAPKAIVQPKVKEGEIFQPKKKGRPKKEAVNI